MDERTKRKSNAQEKLQANKAVVKKLEDIKEKYIELMSSLKPQERGYELERIMYEIFLSLISIQELLLRILVSRLTEHFLLTK